MLSDEQICQIAKHCRAVEGENFLPVTFARAIEAAARRERVARVTSKAAP
ncbi:hypothetical protein [Chitinilyticum litopenaei]|nr:hypothetical protein [Chitinilyticum litopenaei]